MSLCGVKLDVQLALHHTYHGKSPCAEGDVDGVCTQLSA